MLYTPEILRKDFHNMRVITNDSELRYLEEGKHHNGKAHTIRFVAQKLQNEQNPVFLCISITKSKL